VVEELGFDACVDYKAGKLKDDLKAALPKGVDGLFENVGGEIFDALLARTNAFGRIALCGMIADYNTTDPYCMKNVRTVLINRLKLQGFIVSEHMDQWPAALRELGGMVASGKLHYRESIAQGLERAPEAFIGLLKGRNFGKQLVKLV
jgi:NADPH-dependent curcumin reductase CurA